ncbi:hypothetical protein lerEdw1_012121 [Lerista edwardsae]|nr:hypothetical protein lerEdw1_012121 [Lerista edwardsae]
MENRDKRKVLPTARKDQKYQQDKESALEVCLEHTCQYAFSSPHRAGELKEKQGNMDTESHCIFPLKEVFVYQTHASKELEEQLRSVSSVDELMTVLYPEYWKMFKCQLRKGSWQQNREQSSYDARSEDSNPIKFAAAHYNAEILKSIDNEWRKTQCMPREVCVDVGKEFGATTNTFFKPPCVSIYRCGGCCNSEGLQCMNISTGYISKTLFEITVPLSHGPKPVTISFANHTSCRCMSKLDVYRQVHSIIRRSLSVSQPQ